MWGTETGLQIGLSNDAFFHCRVLFGGIIMLINFSIQIIPSILVKTINLQHSQKPFFKVRTSTTVELRDKCQY